MLRRDSGGMSTRPLRRFAGAELIGDSQTALVTVGGNTSYGGQGDLPPLVRAAVELAAGQGFDHSCAPAQGRLLALLAAARPGPKVGETGTGGGGGLAWVV